MDLNFRQDKSAYRCASAPQGRTCHISRINTCTYRDPPDSLSFGPRHNDRAEWTTTRHIDLTLSISSPMFFPFSSRCLLASSLSFLALVRSICSALYIFPTCRLLNFASAGVFLPATFPIIDSPQLRQSPTSSKGDHAALYWRIFWIKRSVFLFYDCRCILFTALVSCCIERKCSRDQYTLDAGHLAFFAVVT
jgi:hypothetical protein